MNATNETTEIKDRKAILSTVWIFVVLNYVYGDLAMMIFHPATYQRLTAGMSELLVLGAAAFMELPIAMVLSFPATEPRGEPLGEHRHRSGVLGVCFRDPACWTTACVLCFPFGCGNHRYAIYRLVFVDVAQACRPEVDMSRRSAAANPAPGGGVS